MLGRIAAVATVGGRKPQPTARVAVRVMQKHAPLKDIRRSRAPWALACILPLSGTFAETLALFSEAAQPSGLDFVHFNGMSGEFYYPEVVGPGAALFDYDNDGDLDVYLVQGEMLGPKKLADALFPPEAGQPLSDRLFRNDLAVQGKGSRSLRFTDVTAQSGIAGDGYGIGVAAGDIDNDGWTDLYVLNWGPNRLLRNNGDGTFADITTPANANDPQLSVSAAFLDYDRDGWLDLYVVNHVHFSIAEHKPCEAPLGGREYCATHRYETVPGRLLRNRGSGRFDDVSVKSGIKRAFGAGLGIVTADYNGDGWLDIYVANDGDPNQLWVNQQDGTFRDEALLAGAAVNMDGVAEAGMGVDAGDFDGDGDEDLFMTHDREETNTIYVNDGQGWFEDRTVATGLARPSQGLTGFGAAWFDYDNDGWLDLFIANGDVRTIAELARAGDPYPLDQPNQLIANLGDGTFRDVSQQAGKAVTLPEVSRGAAFGDIDNDGDTDILVTNNSGRARLLINLAGNRQHWLGLRLLDRSGRDALGARVAVYQGSGPVLWRRARSDASYASANDPRVLVGLGDATTVARILIYWPEGEVEEWTKVPVDGYVTLRQNAGTPIMSRQAAKNPHAKRPQTNR